MKDFRIGSVCKYWNEIIEQQNLWKDILIDCGLSISEVERDLKKLRLVHGAKKVNYWKEYCKQMDVYYLETILYQDG